MYTYSEHTEGLLDGCYEPLELGAAGQHQRQPRAALASLTHAPLLNKYNVEILNCV